MSRIITLSIFIVLLFLSCDDNPIKYQAKGTLVIKTIPDSATLFINDSLTSIVSPATIELPKGWYSLRFEKFGYLPFRNTVLLEDNKTTTTTNYLVDVASGIIIVLEHNTENQTLFFNYKFNQQIKLQSISVTHPTTNFGNYVVYSEQFNNTNIIPSLNYRFPQQTINNFQHILGQYSFVFKCTFNGFPFEKTSIISLLN